MSAPVPHRPEFRRVVTVTVLVRDIDEAVAWYRKKLNFLLIADDGADAPERTVQIGPSVRTGARLLLVKARNEAEAARVGDQTAGRPLLVLETDDIDRDHQRMSGRGVVFRSQPRHEPRAISAVFEDLYGNPFLLTQPEAG